MRMNGNEIYSVSELKCSFAIDWQIDSYYRVNLSFFRERQELSNS